MEDERLGDVVDQMREEISSEFPHEDTSGFAVTASVLLLARHIHIRREQLLATFGLTEADYDVLATLRRHDHGRGITAGALQRSVMITSGGLSKRLDRLQQAGLLTRNADEADRRAVRVKLTPKGRRLVARALPAVLASEAELVRQAIPGHREQERLFRLLRQFPV